MVASRIEEAEEIYELARAEYIMSIEKMSLGRTDFGKDSDKYRCLKEDAQIAYKELMEAKKYVMEVRKEEGQA